MSKPPESPPPLLSANEAGLALDVTGASVRRWVRDGQVKPTKITESGYYLFDLADLKRQRAGMAEIRAPKRRYETVDGKRRLVREEAGA
jgi:hypothetical protein